jgi:hypothetical protein
MVLSRGGAPAQLDVVQAWPAHATCKSRHHLPVARRKSEIASAALSSSLSEAPGDSCRSNRFERSGSEGGLRSTDASSDLRFSPSKVPIVTNSTAPSIHQTIAWLSRAQPRNDRRNSLMMNFSPPEPHPWSAGGGRRGTPRRPDYSIGGRFSSFPIASRAARSCAPSSGRPIARTAPNDSPGRDSPDGSPRRTAPIRRVGAGTVPLPLVAAGTCRRRRPCIPQPPSKSAEAEGT